MVDPTKLEKEIIGTLQAAFDSRVPVLEKYPGVLGQSNNRGSAAVDGKQGWVHVRTGNSETLGQAFNNRVPSRNGLPVYVGYDPVQPTLFQVLSVRQVYHDESAEGEAIAPHHTQHEWPGEDVVYSSIRQMTPGRVSVDSGLTIKMYPCVAPLDGEWVEVDEQTLDLTSNKPATGVRYVLIYLDSDGVLSASDGTIRTTDTELSLEDCPMPSTGELALAAVRLSFVATALVDSGVDTDFEDLRMFPNTGDLSNLLGEVREIVREYVARAQAEIQLSLDMHIVRGGIIG